MISKFTYYEKMYNFTYYERFKLFSPPQVHIWLYNTLLEIENEIYVLDILFFQL